MSRDRAWYRVKICRPAAARFELMGGRIERGIAAGTGVDTRAGHVLVVGTGVWGLGSLLAEDAELLCVALLVNASGGRNCKFLTFVQDRFPFAVTFCDGISHVFGRAGAAKKRSNKGERWHRPDDGSSAEGRKGFRRCNESATACIREYVEGTNYGWE